MAFLQLLSVCVLMFASSMVVGCLPLLFSFRRHHLRFLSTAGVGLLIGLAFIVIIPEGIHSMYSAEAAAAPERRPHIAEAASPLQWQYWRPLLVGDGPATAGTSEPPFSLQLPAEAIAQSKANAKSGRSSARSSPRFRVLSTGEMEPMEPMEPQPRAPEGGAALPCITEPEGSAHIGAALAFGFVFMLLVDRLSSPSTSSASSSSSSPSPAHAGESAGRSPRLSLTVAKPGGNAFNSPVASPVERQFERSVDEDADVVQRTNLIHIPINRDLIAGSISSGGLSGLQRQQSSGGEKEREVSPEKERERQRVERAKERERAHGYQPYALSNTAAATVLTPPSLSHLSSSAFSQSATLGILVHSVVDGLALGAASLSSDASLEAVAFLALALHKCPAAFGLVSFLMHQGRSSLEIRAHLAIFSLCAPVAAVLTFILMVAPLPSAASLPSPSSPATIGLCLLFSGGTFLFTIAVHIMPALALSTGEARRARAVGGGEEGTGEEGDEGEQEGLLHGGHGHSHGGGGGGGSDEGEDGGQALEWRYVLCLIAGILSPLIFAWRPVRI